jgi:hypothetical protein
LVIISKSRGSAKGTRSHWNFCARPYCRRCPSCNRGSG